MEKYFISVWDACLNQKVEEENKYDEREAEEEIFCFTFVVFTWG